MIVLSINNQSSVPSTPEQAQNFFQQFLEYTVTSNHTCNEAFFSLLKSSDFANRTALPCVSHSSTSTGGSIHLLKLLTNALPHLKLCIPSMPRADKLFFVIVLYNFFSLIVINGVFLLSSQSPTQKSPNFSFLVLLNVFCSLL